MKCDETGWYLADWTDGQSTYLYALIKNTFNIDMVPHGCISFCHGLSGIVD